MTTPVGATSASSPVPPGTTAGRSEGLGQDAFMKLLVAQLKYQNPMAPADGQQYMTQMATFAQVEKLGQLLTAQTDLAVWQKRVSAEGMVGKQVSGTSSGDEGAEPVSGVVTGVRFDKRGPVLELAGGRTLTVDQVERVGTAPVAATVPVPAPVPAATDRSTTAAPAA